MLDFSVTAGHTDEAGIFMADIGGAGSKRTIVGSLGSRTGLRSIIVRPVADNRCGRDGFGPAEADSGSGGTS